MTINLPTVNSFCGTNTTMIKFGPSVYYFSYKTLIAFKVPGRILVIRENVWGNTTGKHLNAINSDKSRRVGLKRFAETYADAHQIGVTP